MNKYLNKLSSLMKGRKLLGRMHPKGFRMYMKNADEARAANNMLHLNDTGESALVEGKKLKINVPFTDGSHGFVRATPGKGVRARLYSKKQDFKGNR